MMYLKLCRKFDQKFKFVYQQENAKETESHPPGNDLEDLSDKLNKNIYYKIDVPDSILNQIKFEAGTSWKIDARATIHQKVLLLLPSGESKVTNMPIGNRLTLLDNQVLYFGDADPGKELVLVQSISRFKFYLPLNIFVRLVANSAVIPATQVGESATNQPAAEKLTIAEFAENFGSPERWIYTLKEDYTKKIDEKIADMRNNNPNLTEKESDDAVDKILKELRLEGKRQLSQIKTDSREEFIEVQPYRNQMSQAYKELIQKYLSPEEVSRRNSGILTNENVALLLKP